MKTRSFVMPEITLTSNDRLSASWEHNASSSHCHECTIEFNATNRRHHCRLCGKIFCQDCSSQRSLIPPSSIVLIPKGGGGSTHSSSFNSGGGPMPSSTEGFIPEYSNPDLTAMHNSSRGGDSEVPTIRDGSCPYSNSTGNADGLLYGKGLEERYKLAREPLRVCDLCYEQLKPLQDELRASNSNAVRYNSIDPTDLRRLFNSPLAFTLGHEVRKAAYTLNNLLPLPKRSNLLYAPIKEKYSLYDTGKPSPIADCQNNCKTISPNLGDIDGVRIPARLLEEAKGIAVLTVVKGGFVVGGEVGTGLVVSRLNNADSDMYSNYTEWSAPSSIGAVGLSWGAMAGAQISDHVFLLMTDAAVELMATNEGSIQLGADIGVAIGPLGRTLEGNIGATKSSGSGTPAMAPIYTYSLSKGFYAGVSLDGKVIMTRHRVNEKFYGYKVSASALLSGAVPSPPAAQPLYDALKRCHVYATNSVTGGGVAADINEMCRGSFNPSKERKLEANHNSHSGTQYRDDEGRDFDVGNDGFAGVTLPPPTFRSTSSPSDSSLSTSESSFFL